MQIRIEDISKTFGPRGGTVAVDHVSLRVDSGELFFLLGPSGCGKTTLLRMVAGLATPDGGRIILGDRDVTALPCEKRHTAMVFQNYALWPHMTVRRNVEFAPRMQGLSRKQRRRTTGENLRRVELEPLGGRKPNQLSGGQQQRVAVARALAANADCLLLDEPLSNLDARLRAHMRGELRGLVKAAGTTAIYVTHDQKEALSMADRIAVMNAGRIVQIDTPQEMYDHPGSRFVADFLGEANFLPGTVVATGRTAQIETAAGILSAAATGDLSPGESVTCCVRPERITLSPAAPGGDPSAAGLPARVESCTYLGESRQYSCRLGDGSPWRVLELATSSAPPAPKSEVTLHVAPENVILLKE